MGKINLKLANTNEDYLYISNLMYTESGIKDVFLGKESRVVCAYDVFLIQLDNVNIGYIYATDEQLESFGFVDVAIVKKHRGHGYSKIAVLQLIKYYLENYPNTRFYLIGETKKNNLPANNSVKEIGTYLFSICDRNFYLINKEMYDDLVETNNIELLIDHCTKGAKSACDILRQVKEDEYKKRR